jgi:hypothetical protein
LRRKAIYSYQKNKNCKKLEFPQKILQTEIKILWIQIQKNRSRIKNKKNLIKSNKDIIIIINKMHKRKINFFLNHTKILPWKRKRKVIKMRKQFLLKIKIIIIIRIKSSSICFFSVLWLKICKIRLVEEVGSIWRIFKNRLPIFLIIVVKEMNI